jgi:LCP family protein required for cell wall assembly
MSRSPLLWLVAAVLLLAGAGVIVFALTGDEPVAVATPSPSPEPSPTPEPTPTPTPTPEPTPTPTPEPTPTPTPIDEALLDRRVTVLVLGLDRNIDRARAGHEINADTIIVASVSADYSTIHTIGFPRDTVDIPLGDGRTWTRKINAIYHHHGAAALRNAVQATLDIPIDYYVAVDMTDLFRITNALDRVEIEVTQHHADPAVELYIAPGIYEFGGNDLLRYVRTRRQGGDYARSARNQQALIAMVRELADKPHDFDLIALARSLEGLETNLPLDKLFTMREIVERSANARVVPQVLSPPRFARFAGLDGPRGWVMIANVPEMRAYAQATIGR